MDQVDSGVTRKSNPEPHQQVVQGRSALHSYKEQASEASHAPAAEGHNPNHPDQGYWKQLVREKPDRHIELFLTLAIGFFALVQLIVSYSNNNSTSQQTQQLITAAGISAIAAKQNAQAARDFTQSARAINEGVSDAVSKLGLQAQRTEEARESSADQSRASLQATIDNFQADQRPWVGVEVIFKDSRGLCGVVELCKTGNDMK